MYKKFSTTQQIKEKAANKTAKYFIKENKPSGPALNFLRRWCGLEPQDLGDTFSILLMEEEKLQVSQEVWDKLIILCKDNKASHYKL